jgi:hypothetical protein
MTSLVTEELEMDSFSLRNPIICSPAMRKRNLKKQFAASANVVEKLLMDLVQLPLPNN